MIVKYQTILLTNLHLKILLENSAIINFLMNFLKCFAIFFKLNFFFRNGKVYLYSINNLKLPSYINSVSEHIVCSKHDHETISCFYKIIFQRGLQWWWFSVIKNQPTLNSIENQPLKRQKVAKYFEYLIIFESIRGILNWKKYNLRFHILYHFISLYALLRYQL